MRRRRPVLAAMFAVVLLVVGQLAAFAHQAWERHVTCAEHGEELEAVDLVDALDACGACDHDHVIGVDGDDGGGHDECAAMRALHQHGASTASWTPPCVVARSTELATALPAQTHDERTLYLIAPKTSPPQPS